MTGSPPPPGLLTAVAQAALFAVLPSGGQHRALRNAWAALRRALVRAEPPVDGTAAAGR